MNAAQNQKLIHLTSQQIKQFDKICDLYIDFQGWQLLVRIIDISYKQFISKQNKLVKILTLVLVDQNKHKIEATVFGDQGKQIQNKIKKGSVYRISGGQVKQHLYNQTKTDLLFPLNIILTKSSKIQQVQDLEAIPYRRNYITIPQVVKQMNYQKHYEIAAMLLQIGEDRQLQKSGQRSIFKKVLLVGDPQSGKSIEAIIWSKNVTVQPSLLHKPILLKHFRLNTYRQQLSLSSVFRSQIQFLQCPPFKSKYNYDLKYEPIVGSSKNKQSQSPVLYQSNTQQRSIREIQQQLGFLRIGQCLQSQVQVWITFLRFQGKWYYNSCNNPKCKKTTEPQSKCKYCGHYNQQISYRYILPVEMSDFTGSLWTTAFDDFANDIFKGYNLETLVKWDEHTLKNFAQKYFYRQYKLRLSTKKQHDGQIRHVPIGKPVQIIIEKSMKNNIDKIIKAIY